MSGTGERDYANGERGRGVRLGAWEKTDKALYVLFKGDHTLKNDPKTQNRRQNSTRM